MTPKGSELSHDLTADYSPEWHEDTAHVAPVDDGKYHVGMIVGYSLAISGIVNLLIGVIFL